jgi:hypothetical protein
MCNRWRRTDNLLVIACLQRINESCQGMIFCRLHFAQSLKQLTWLIRLLALTMHLLHEACMGAWRLS